MKSLIQTDIRYLPLVVKAIKQKNSSGKLQACQEEQLAELYFSQGKLVHATDKAGVQGDAVLYDILNWSSDTTRLEWQPGTVSEESTVDYEEEKIWLEAMTALQGRGYFQAESNPETEVILKDLLADTSSDLVSPENNPLSAPEIVMPVGQVLFQLNRAVLGAEVKTYLSLFEESLFSGYIQCQPLSENKSQISFTKGLIIIQQGIIVYSLLNFGLGQADLSAKESLKYLQQTGFIAEVIEVAPRLLEAWRSLLDGQQIYSEIAATTNNYQKLRENFARSGRSGAVQLYYRGLKLYTLVYQGQDLSIFRVESENSQSKAFLQKLTEIPEFLLNNPDVKLAVFLSASAKPVSLDEEYLSLDEVQLLDRSFQAVMRLVGEIATPNQIEQHLNEVVKTGSHHYPILGSLQIEHSTAGFLPQLIWQENGSKIVSTPKPEVISACDYLFENFLQEYCKPIGDTAFHAMAARAINPLDALKLNELGLHLDFLEDYPPDPAAAAIEQLAFSLKAEIVTTPQIEPAEEYNPYEF